VKRSFINQIIKEAEQFIKAHNFALPAWAYAAPQRLLSMQENAREVFQHGLGWDITDFSSLRFEKQGLVLITLRNGGMRSTKPYAEKIMIAREEQETPMHFHYKKMEDIINRGGGVLVLELYKSASDETLSRESFTVQIDGVSRQCAAGERVELEPGQSICLTQGLYHRFFGKKGSGPVLIGEVSMVNDDSGDNRFLIPCGRFSDVEEDAPPYRLLVSDYANLQKFMPGEKK